MDIADQLRARIDESRMSQYEICKKAGVSEPHMSRFMHGRSGLSLRTLSALCDVLGLELKRSRHG